MPRHFEETQNNCHFEHSEKSMVLIAKDSSLCSQWHRGLFRVSLRDNQIRILIAINDPVFLNLRIIRKNYL